MQSILQMNRELADKIVADARQNPQAYPRKYVGLANGRIVVVSDDLDEIDRRLDDAESDPTNVFIVEPGLDTNKVHEIWEVG